MGMTSVMDSSSLRDDGRDMHRMSNVMGRGMSTDSDINMLRMDQQMYSNTLMGRNIMGLANMGRNKMGQDSMRHNTMHQDSMGRNMMDRNIYATSSRGMKSDMSNMIGQQMDSNAMGVDMTMNVMGRNMMAQDRNSQMMSHNMMGRQDISPNIMNNMMNSNNRLMGQPIMQQMQRVPETYTSTIFF